MNEIYGLLECSLFVHMVHASPHGRAHAFQYALELDCLHRLSPDRVHAENNEKITFVLHAYFVLLCCNCFYDQP